MSNQKQIGIAYKLYSDDHTDSYPVHDGWASVVANLDERERLRHAFDLATYG